MLALDLKAVLLPAVSHLVIDVGNSRTKYGVFFDEELLKVIAVSETIPGEHLKPLKEEYQPTIMMVSDVSGKWDTVGSDLALVRLGPKTPLPFINRYGTPDTLGSDRKALVAGALHFFQNTHCLIIDAGTCVTYDILNASKEYLGGAISPGLRMRLRAMHTFTGKLPMPELTDEIPLLGTDTDSCLRSGAFHGLLSEVEGFIRGYQEKFESLKILVTGGDASLLAKNLKTDIFAHEHLLLFGLNSILSKHAN